MRAVKSVSIDGSTETLYPNCIWCDSEALRELIKDLLEEKADAITQTIENVTVASFADGADEGLIKKLLVSIEPIQEGSGDPSPENVRPISGRTGLSVVRSGKNLLEVKRSNTTTNGVTFTKQFDSDGNCTGVLVNGTATANAYYDFNVVGAEIQNSGLIDGLEYIFSGLPSEGSASTFRLRIGNSSGTSINYTNSANGLTFAKTVDQVIFGIQIISGFTADNLLFKPMIRLASDNDGNFVPYKANTYSVNWETEVGTVYGGYVDVVSGKLVVDRADIDLASKAFSYQNDAGTTKVFKFGILTIISGGIISNRFSTSIPSGTPGRMIYDAQNFYMAFPAAEISANTDAAVHAWLDTHPTQVIAKLKNPITITLTPQEVRTLLGENNIWADSGNILELEYTADTKLYISERQSGTSGALGSGRQEIVNPDIQTVPEKTLEDVEAYKEVTDARGEK